MNFNIKQLTGQLLLVMGALGIVLPPSVNALPTSHSAPQAILEKSDTPPESTEEQSETNDFDTYKSEQFTVLYPPTWQATAQAENSVAIIGPTVGEGEPNRTDIELLRADPNEVVPQTLDQLSAQGVSIQRYSLVTVDSQSGMRIWYTADTSTSQQSLVTFVGYGDQQTAILTSHYDVNDANAEDIITTLHNSFKNHSVAQAIVPQ